MSISSFANITSRRVSGWSREQSASLENRVEKIEILDLTLWSPRTFSLPMGSSRFQNLPLYSLQAEAGERFLCRAEEEHFRLCRSCRSTAYSYFYLFCFYSPLKFHFRNLRTILSSPTIGKQAIGWPLVTSALRNLFS